MFIHVFYTLFYFNTYVTMYHLLFYKFKQTLIYIIIIFYFTSSCYIPIVKCNIYFHDKDYYYFIKYRYKV